MTDHDADFLAFHAENPQVYGELVRLARKARRQGKTVIGIRMLWEVTRWNLWLRSKSPDEYKLNNNLTSRYARLIMKRERDLKGIFNIRNLRRKSE